MSSVPRAMTPMETIEVMLAETQNEINRCEIMEKMFQKALLKGTRDPMMGMNQTKLHGLKEALKNLGDIHKEMLAAVPPPVA